MSEKQPVTVSLSAHFIKRIKRLGKKYPRITDDIQPVIDQQLSGKTPGDRLQGIKSIVYKVRVRNRDARRGKSGGYRVIYYIQRADQIMLITIYAKSDADNIATDEVARLIDDIDDN